MCELKNTVRFTFNSGADKPAIGEVVAFVKGLDAEHDEIEAAYRMAEEKSLFVKFKSEQSMMHVLTANSDELLFHYANGKKVKVHMSHAQDNICYVRIYDLPPEIPDQEIVSVLAKYGRVKRVVREKFPAELKFDAFTGVRGVYMDVNKEIPTSLHFASRRGNIYYPGNKDKCYICKEEGHLMASCSRRKARSKPENRPQEKVQIVRSSCNPGGTYASAVTGGAGTEEETGGLSETIEVLEEEMEEAAVVETVMPAVTENNEEEAKEDDPHNHPVYKLFSYLAEQGEKMKEANHAKEEEAKIKSPPRKKKNCSLYKK